MALEKYQVNAVTPLLRQGKFNVNDVMNALLKANVPSAVVEREAYDLMDQWIVEGLVRTVDAETWVRA